MQLGEKLGPVRWFQSNWFYDLDNSIDRSESDRGEEALLPLWPFLSTSLWRSALRSPCFWWRRIHRRWRKIPYGFILRMIKMPISIVDLERVLLCHALYLQQALVLNFKLLNCWWFRIWSRSCSWWRCSLRRICNNPRCSYIFFCFLSSQSWWFVCFVKLCDVCLGFHRGKKEVCSRCRMAFEHTYHSP